MYEIQVVNLSRFEYMRSYFSFVLFIIKYPQAIIGKKWRFIKKSPIGSWKCAIIGPFLKKNILLYTKFLMHFLWMSMENF